MICPHCGIGTSPNFANRDLGTQGEGSFVTAAGNCTECHDLIVVARWITGDPPFTSVSDDFVIYPLGPHTRPVPPEVTGEYAQDFREACAVVELSPKASAALSRRLLQHILREKAGITKRDLNAEIDAAIAEGDLPSDLAEDLDMIRTVGNFAAHPMKSTHTGDVVEVEPGEAAALLDLVEALLDQYFVRPARRAARRDAHNAKLSEAGKPPLKESAASPPDAPPIAP